MAFAYPNDQNEWVEIDGPFALGDLQYPHNWPDLAPLSEERAAAGIVEIAEPTAPGQLGRRSSGRRSSDVAGVPTRSVGHRRLRAA
jgi:hypothetical protein